MVLHEKFWPEIAIFDQIHPGDRLSVGTGCGEPHHLVGALKGYVEKRPNSLFGAEMIHIWTLGIMKLDDFLEQMDTLVTINICESGIGWREG